MHLRAVLRGILKRTNSSSSNLTRSQTSSTSTTAETRPTSSNGVTAVNPKSGYKVRIGQAFADERVRGTSAYEAEERPSDDTIKDSSDKPTKDKDESSDEDDEDYYSLHSRQQQLRGDNSTSNTAGTGTGAGTTHNLGPKTDRRLADEGIKLHLDKTASTDEEAPQAVGDSNTTSLDNKSEQPKGNSQAQGNPTLLLELPTPDDNVVSEPLSSSTIISPQ